MECSPILSLLTLWAHELRVQWSRLADVRAICGEHHTRVLLYELHHLAQAIEEDDHSGIEAAIV